jgi:hypothetical protein
MEILIGFVMVSVLSFLAGYGVSVFGTKQLIETGELIKRDDVKRMIRLRERL